MYKYSFDITETYGTTYIVEAENERAAKKTLDDWIEEHTNDYSRDIEKNFLGTKVFDPKPVSNDAKPDIVQKTADYELILDGAIGGCVRRDKYQSFDTAYGAFKWYLEGLMSAVASLQIDVENEVAKVVFESGTKIFIRKKE